MLEAGIIKATTAVAKLAAREVAKEVTKEVAKEVGRMAASEINKLPDKLGKVSEVKNLTNKLSAEQVVGEQKNSVAKNFVFADGRLLPNQTFEANGYEYKTDGQGRIISAEGKLRLKDRPDRLPIADSMDKIGRGNQRETDERGHLIGDQFDGSNRLENLVPMAKELNRGDYLRMEKELADAIKDGKDVYFKVKPVYEGDSARPVAFKCSYSIDGEKFARFFDNGG